MKYADSFIEYMSGIDDIPCDEYAEKLDVNYVLENVISHNIVRHQILYGGYYDE